MRHKKKVAQTKYLIGVVKVTAADLHILSFTRIPIDNVILYRYNPAAAELIFNRDFMSRVVKAVAQTEM